jgi:hypothetical protein
MKIFIDYLINQRKKRDKINPTLGMPVNPSNDFEYKYNAGLSGIEITKYTGKTVRVRIPKDINGEEVG